MRKTGVNQWVFFSELPLAALKRAVLRFILFDVEGMKCLPRDLGSDVDKGPRLDGLKRLRGQIKASHVDWALVTAVLLDDRLELGGWPKLVFLAFECHQAGTLICALAGAAKPSRPAKMNLVVMYRTFRFRHCLFNVMGCVHHQRNVRNPPHIAGTPLIARAHRLKADRQLPGTMRTTGMRPCVDGPPLASLNICLALLVGAAMCPTCWCGT